MFCLYQSYPFEAARRLPQAPAGSPQTRWHGHSFQVKVSHSFQSGTEASLLQQWKEELAPLIASLDYQDLGEVTGLFHPDDGSVLEWLGQKLPVEAWSELEFTSAPGQGTCWSRMDSCWHGFRQFTLHSAHFLPHVPPGHKCGRLHGHNFQVILHWQSTTRLGLLSAEAIAEAFAPTFQRLHQHLLNEIPGLENPTSEVLSSWLWRELRQVLPNLEAVTVYETRSAGCHYRGQLWDCFKEFELDSALPGPWGPMGHSYLVRLHLLSELDPHLGWTLDYGEMKERFQPFFKQIDHQELSSILGLPEVTLEAIARWIEHQMLPTLPALAKIQVSDTPGHGMLYLREA